MPVLLQRFYTWLLPIRPITALTTASFAMLMHQLEWHGAALERAVTDPIAHGMAAALERFLERMDAPDA